MNDKTANNTIRNNSNKISFLGRRYAIDILVSLENPKRFVELADACPNEKTRAEKLKELAEKKLVTTIIKHANGRPLVYYNLTKKGEIIRDGLLNLLQLIETKRFTEFLKRAEKALGETENRYFEEIFENADDGIFIVDNEGKFIAMNKKIAEFFGCERQELIGKSFAPFLIEEDRKKSLSLFPKMLKGDVETLEIRAKAADALEGEIKHIELKVSPLKENGKVIGISGIARDITKWKILEQLTYK